MCDPVTMAVVSTGLSIAGTAGGYMQANDAAAQQTALHEQNKINATAAFEQNQRALNEQAAQLQDQAAQERLQMDREFDAAKATALVATEQAGIYGATANALLRDLGAQQDTRIGISKDNQRNALRQNFAQKEALGVNMLNQINSVPVGQKPSFASLAIGIGGNLLDGYTTYQQNKAKLNG